jgi:hypothetical protein
MSALMVDTQRLRSEVDVLRFRAVLSSDLDAGSALNSAADLLEEIASDIERAASLSQPRKSEEVGTFATMRSLARLYGAPRLKLRGFVERCGMLRHRWRS